jgi:uncharacterized protein (TIGR00255 family)
MTGFGRSVCELPAKRVSIEIKSLNSKQLDINIRIPSLYREKELELRNELSAQFIRGKIDLTIVIESATSDKITSINIPVIESYYNQLNELAERLKISDNTDFIRAALSLPDATRTEQPDLGEDEWLQLKESFMKAVDSIDEFRSHEGAALKVDLEERACTIHLLLNRIEPFEKQRIDKIKARIRESLDDAVGRANVDENRFEQEMIYYIEKLDISEEKTRLRNHIEYFFETLNEDGDVGKKIGFITQEMGREINTLGSKANETNIQKLVIMMKDELEKIKEQALNIL